MIKTLYVITKVFHFSNIIDLGKLILIINPKQKYLRYSLLFSLCLLLVSCSSVNIQKDLNDQKLSLSDNYSPVAIE